MKTPLLLFFIAAIVGIAVLLWRARVSRSRGGQPKLDSGTWREALKKATETRATGNKADLRMPEKPKNMLDDLMHHPENPASPISPNNPANPLSPLNPSNPMNPRNRGR